MKQYQKILKLIKELNGNDKAKIDEINKRVMLYVHRTDVNPDQIIDCAGCKPEPIYTIFHADSYVQRLDVTKALIPPRWAVDMTIYSTHEDATVEMYKMDETGNETKNISGLSGVEIEPCLLYAVIQAIAYDRGEWEPC